MPTISHRQTVWEHLDELRAVVVRCLGVIGAGMLIALLSYHSLFALLTRSLQPPGHPAIQTTRLAWERHQNQSTKTEVFQLPPHSTVGDFGGGAQLESDGSCWLPPNGWVDLTQPAPQQLLLLGPIDGALATLKIAFWVGLTGSSPIWGYLLLGFIVPGLHRRERQALVPFLVGAGGFLVLGILFGFKISLPLANRMLYAFNATIGLNQWSLYHYLSYAVTFLLAHALAAEAFWLLLLLVHLRVVHPTTLRRHRRGVIIAIFIMAALFTPPDVMTQCLLAVPLIVLYELAILYGRTRFTAKSGYRPDPVYRDRLE